MSSETKREDVHGEGEKRKHTEIGQETGNADSNMTINTNVNIMLSPTSEGAG